MKDALPIVGLILAIFALLRQNRQLTAAAIAPPAAKAAALNPVGLDDRVAEAWAARRRRRNPGHEPVGEAMPQPVPVGM